MFLPSDDPAMGELRLLVIDDEEESLRLIERVLSPSFPNLMVISDARQVRDILVEWAPDLVVVDLHMPQISGLAVIQAVREVIPTDDFVPVLVLTADVSPEVKREALAMGATDFLIKPIEVVEVDLRVTNLARTRHLHRVARHARTALEETVADRTAELAEANARLSDLVRAKDEFIASVSHELRTPLTVVLGFAEELHNRSEAFEEMERADLLGAIVDQATDLSLIIEDLLVAARADMETLPIRVEIVQLSLYVDRAVTALAPKDRARLTVDVPDLSVSADPLRMTQVMRNLLTNAARYGGSRIELKAQQVGEMVAMDVSDDGPPLAIGDADRIFDAYHTAHIIDGQPAAVGLGLTVSRELARLMGGDVTYTHDGSNSTFRFTLPQAPVT